MEKCDICKQEIRESFMGIKSSNIYSLEIKRYSERGIEMLGNEMIQPIVMKICSNCNQKEKIINKFKELFCDSI